MTDAALSSGGASDRLRRALESARTGSEHDRRAIGRLPAIGARAIPVDDADYPEQLRRTYSPPLVIFVRGSLAALGRTGCTIVGTRQPTAYGTRMTHAIVRSLADQDIAVISGLAYGIDGDAHRAALANGRPTIAVLGNSIDTVYPTAHRQLAEDMLAAQGAIISEYPPGLPTQRHFFPQRNRILAGLSAVTIIVEAGRRSGALITAKMALDEGREVMAVPGPVDSSASFGPNDLIRHGATPYVEPADVLTALGFGPETSADRVDLPVDDPAQRTVLTLLQEARHVDELAAMSTLDTSTVCAALTVLEIRGRVRHLGGMRYERLP